ncbi:MAG: transglycosylase SLT domain-containing protein, partial [Acidimicrobiales bacterium]
DHPAYAALVAALALPLAPVLALVAAAKFLQTNWETVWSAIHDAVSTAWSAIQSIWNTITSFLSGPFSTATSAFQALWDAAWKVASFAVDTAWGIIKGIWDFMTGFLTGAFGPVIEGFQQIWDAAWSAISSAVSTAWDVIKGIWDTISSTLKDNLGGAMDTFSGAWKRAWDAVGVAIRSVWQNVIKPVLDAIKSGVQDAIGFLDGLASKAGSIAGQLASGNILGAAQTAFGGGGGGGGGVVGGGDFSGGGGSGGGGTFNTFQSISDLTSAQQAAVDSAHQLMGALFGQADAHQTTADAANRVTDVLVGHSLAPAFLATAHAAHTANVEIDKVKAQIASVAQALGVPVNLALAIAQQESGFNPRAVGDGGHSIGVFQLNDMGEGAGMSIRSRENVATNARIALSVVRDVMAQHPGMDPGAIAAAAQRPADRSGYARSVDAILANMGGIGAIAAIGAQAASAATAQAVAMLPVNAPEQFAPGQTPFGADPGYGHGIIRSGPFGPGTMGGGPLTTAGMNLDKGGMVPGYGEEGGKAAGGGLDSRIYPMGEDPYYLAAHPEGVLVDAILGRLASGQSMQQAVAGARSEFSAPEWAKNMAFLQPWARPHNSKGQEDPLGNLGGLSSQDPRLQAQVQQVIASGYLSTIPADSAGAPGQTGYIAKGAGYNERAARSAQLLKEFLGGGALSQQITEAVKAMGFMTSAMGAMADQGANLRAMLDQVTQSFAENGNSLSTLDDAGKHNIATLGTLNDSVAAIVTSMATQNASAVDLRGVLQAQADELQHVGEVSGLTRGEIDKLIATYHLTPKEIDTRVQLLGVQEAMQATGDLAKYVKAKMDEATAAVKAFTGTAFDNLNAYAKASSAEGAFIQAEQAASAATGYGSAGYGQGIDLNREIGRKNRQILEQIVSTGEAYIQTLLAQHASADDVAASMQRVANDVTIVAENAGLSAAAVIQLQAQLGIDPAHMSQSVNAARAAADAEAAAQAAQQRQAGTLNINFHGNTMASPQDIAREIAWAMRTQ